MYNKAGNFIYIQCSNNASYSLPVLWTSDQGSYPETEAVAFETEAKTEAARQYINKSHIWAVSLKRKEYKYFLA